MLVIVHGGRGTLLYPPPHILLPHVCRASRESMERLQARIRLPSLPTVYNPKLREDLLHATPADTHIPTSDPEHKAPDLPAVLLLLALALALSGVLCALKRRRGRPRVPYHPLQKGTEEPTECV